MSDDTHYIAPSPLHPGTGTLSGSCGMAIATINNVTFRAVASLIQRRLRKRKREMLPRGWFCSKPTGKGYIDDVTHFRRRS
jgi:hypothetical protein